MNCEPKHISLVLAVAFPAWASAAQASTPFEWAKLDADSAKACIAAAGLYNAKVSAPSRFSDSTGIDVRIVSGIYPPKHMKGTTGKCCAFIAARQKT